MPRSTRADMINGLFVHCSSVQNSGLLLGVAACCVAAKSLQINEVVLFSAIVNKQSENSDRVCFPSVLGCPLL